MGVSLSYVYVITDDYVDDENLSSVGVVKIGFTSDSNIYNRVRQLQTGNPRPLQIIEVHEFQNSDMAKSVEKLCHWNLKAHGLSGEWFVYGPEVKKVLYFISNLSNFYPYQRLEEFFTKHGVKDV